MAKLYAVLCAGLVIAAASPASAGPALLFDADDDRVLYAEDADDQWHPASLTKIMTAYVTFGAIKPGEVTVNLMTANVTAGATAAAGDLLTDLKSGYLLGANPRQQFYAQLAGVRAGAAICVPIYFVLIPSVDLLGTERWPAAIHIGPAPTFGEQGIKVEAHLIGFHGSLYGQPIEADFLSRLRGIQTFASVEELKAQLASDVAAALEATPLHS